MATLANLAANTTKLGIMPERERETSRDQHGHAVHADKVVIGRHRVEEFHLELAERSLGHDIWTLLIVAVGTAIGIGAMAAMQRVAFEIVPNIEGHFGRDGITGAVGWKTAFILMGMVSLGFGLATFFFRRTQERERLALQAQFSDLRARADALTQRFSQYEERKADARSR